MALLYGTDADNGRRVAEEPRAVVASLQLLPNHSVTVSIGLATLQSGEDAIAWMKRSDENLYRAKSGGRSQVAG